MNLRRRLWLFSLIVVTVLVYGFYSHNALERIRNLPSLHVSHAPEYDMGERPPPPPPSTEAVSQPLATSQSKTADTRPPTAIPRNASVHGFTVLDNLYLHNGTLYILTPDSTRFPERIDLLSRPLDIGGKDDLDPTDQELQFLDPKKAAEVLGDHDVKVNGFTVLLYDPAQFMKHYYHWWGEIILGFQRIYSLLGSNADGSMAPLPAPARFLLPFVQNDEWRDKPNVNGPLMRAVFPYSLIEQAQYWNDFISLNVTARFERVMLVNRQAAHRHPYGNRWYKMIAGTMSKKVSDGFWTPIRETLVENLLGYVPDTTTKEASKKPIVAYISRQNGGRRLLATDHEALVDALKELEAEGLCEIQVAAMEQMRLKEQIELAARSTIMLGVHGNGLTHQLWMPPSPISTVIEIFMPGGYVFDYEMLARNMGHRHYAISNDTATTYPKGTYHEGVQFPEGFHGESIPVYAPTVIELIRKRLSGSTDDDDI